MIATISGLEQSLLGGAIVVGVAGVGAIFHLGTSIGRLSEAVKMLLLNDAEHDRRDNDHETRISRLEGYRPGDQP